MGNLLAEVTDDLERQMFFARAREQLERLRDADPDEWQRDRAESQTWQAGTDRDALTTTVFLCTSRPAPCEYNRSMTVLLGSPSLV